MLLRNRAPEVAETGGIGENLEYELELRTMADIGLVGILRLLTFKFKKV